MSRTTCIAIAASLVGLASGGPGCSSEVPVLRPIIDVPPADSTAYPYDGVETLSLSIARAGDERALQETSVPLGDELILPETPFGQEFVIHLVGRVGDVELSYGRTCPIDMKSDGTSDVLAAAGSPALEPHLYFSRIVRWGPGGRPFEGRRTAGLAYALPDGSAVFAGGDPEGRSVERFDPVTAQYAPLGVDLTPRGGAAIATLGDGRALIVGGMASAQEPAALIEVIDPLRSPERQRTEVAGPALREHALATLVNGEVLLAGGRHSETTGQPFAATSSAWLLRFGAGDVLDPPERLAVTMSAVRAGHTLTRLGDDIGADVLIVGGRDDDDVPVAASELYRPLRESFEPVVGAELARPRWNHAAVRMPGGFVLILGGQGPGPTGVAPVVELELYDPSQNRFTPAGVMPDSAGLTEQSVTPLPDGRVLIAGGRDAAGQPVSAAFVARLDPVDGLVDVVPTDNMAVPRAGHSAVRLCDGTILIVGGNDDPAGAGAERYNPVSLGRR